MNTNIEALQTIVEALQKNEYVTSVVPITEGGVEVGYTIAFSSGKYITIYHGTDGADSSDGKDGYAPVIGVKQDADGVYYWTIDGEWLLDDAGNKIPTTGKEGQNGADGVDGKPGTDGKDGITPQLKIEDGMWYVSYDNGASWVELGPATGEQGPQGEAGATGPQGPQGNPGVGGDSMFSNVDYSSSPDYVTFILSNGSEIKVPTWSAFEALKQQCEQMNTNIEALQVIVNALQNNDYIASITPIYEGGKEVGYIINFTKSGKVTIYHGQDGKDGQDGANGSNGTNGTNGTDGVDGHTPIIGVAKDSDGIYYWTVDGSWLLDENGQKVKAAGIDGQNGSNGQNGATGAPGAAGKDGVTPQLKIENGMWYVSYDNGASWIELGQATGDQGPQGNTGATGPQGPQGNPGVDGDAFFQTVDASNSDYVSFVLATGTEIKVPTWSAFETLKQQCEQMNINITALQVIVNALQNNDYISSISPIYDGGKEIGYIINFTKSGKVTIYHGKDGQNGANGSNGTDGANGVDGHTPIIGVAKDTDGIYYWTVDGSWLLDEKGQKVKAVGTDGQNGANGSNGQDGATGAPGAAGKDGVTPQLKIENGMWYVSYDNGASWTELGQATGDQGPQGPQGNTGATGPQGPQGTPGVDGDAFFQSVTETKDYVSMVLANGTEIKIPKYSAVAATLTLGKVTGFTATFDGQVVRHSLDLKVTVYYSTTDNLTVYKHKGKTSVTEFNDDTFTLRLTELAANTTYYYFTEVICDGTTTFSEISSFRTDKEDSYVDWGEGENVGGDI